MQQLSILAAREAVMLIRQNYQYPLLHHIHVDTQMPHECRNWSAEELSERVVKQMVSSLLNTIPNDGVLCPWPLETPKSVMGATWEQYEGVGVRAVIDYLIEYDLTVLRLDLRFWSKTYSKMLKRQAFWRKVKSTIFFWRN